MRPLGPKQIALLVVLAAPDRALVVADKIARSLMKRGLLAPMRADIDGMLRITPAGLRMLATLLEAGELARFLELKRPAAPAAPQPETTRP